MTRRPLGGTVGRTLEETEPREVLGCENVVFESKGVRDETGPEEGQESLVYVQCYTRLTPVDDTDTQS